MVSKKCSKCGEDKVLQSFAVNSKGRYGRKSVCKDCSNKDQRALAKRRREEDPEKWRRYRWEKHLKSAYGLTSEDYFGMLDEQDGLCAICGTDENKVGDKLYVDHCHASLKNRGLLCYHCNTLLGLARDDVDVLRKAIEYLEEEDGSTRDTG